MIERVAEAAFNSTLPTMQKAIGKSPKLRTWAELDKDAYERPIYRIIARAAIEAMREPTKGQCLATSPLLVFPENSETERHIIETATETWQAMIDEALK